MTETISTYLGRLTSLRLPPGFDRGPPAGTTERHADRGIAALNPAFVGLLSATLPLGQSIGVFAGIAYGIVIIAALTLPETKGRELTADV